VAELPLRCPTEEEVVWAREAAQVPLTTGPGPGLDAVGAKRMLWLAEAGAGAGRTRRTYGAEVQALSIGRELAVVGLPGEVFTELGLTLRERSPFRHTLVLSLANDTVGYIPTRRAYDEGGYEVAASCLAPGAGEQLVEEALRLLATLHRGASGETMA
jgi:hypothetical protein